MNKEIRWCERWGEILQSCREQRNGMLEKERVVILNKVTFEQSPGGDEGDCRCPGEVQFRQRLEQPLQKPQI